MLKTSNLVAVIPTANPTQSEAFYGGILGLPLVGENEFSQVYDANGVMLRVTKLEAFEPQSFTVFGWSVEDIKETVSKLKAQGVVFESYPGIQLDDLGLCPFPNGDKVAWFKDPDGNTLNLSQFSKD